MHAQVNIITTIGGNGSGVFGDDVHDDGPATNAQIALPAGLCIDRWDNIIIANFGDVRVRKIDAFTGIITTIGGSGGVGFSGDGGTATNAQFRALSAVSSDSLGDIFIADANNNRVRKIDKLTGIITTIAGSGADGAGMGSFSGDGGMATDATLKVPIGLYIDKYQNIYIADNDNNRIRKVDHLSGKIATVAGNGSHSYAGDNGQATDASLAHPGQAVVDDDGNIYIADYDNNVIRKVTTSTGIITTIAGTGVQGYYGNGGPATDAKLSGPNGIYVDKRKNIFVAELGNGVIRRIDGTTGIITTVAGTGVQGYSGDGGPATAAQTRAYGITLDRHGRILIADADNNRIRMVYDSSEHYVGMASPRPSPKEREVLIYPNPANDELIVTSPDLSEGEEVVIYNLWGQKVMSVRTTKKHEVTMNVAGSPSGMYIIQIVDPSSGLRMTRRFVKE
ncbi:MAG: Leucinerich repeat protein-like protein [Flavipsychrobacter sp.]|nr:Leucinerich repeat protein-like protein [Flavipsychrobacter sp.]